MKNNSKFQAGFTLIELLIAIAISGIIGTAVITLTMQTFSLNADATNHQKTVKQLENSIHYISRIAQMAQTITVTDSNGDILTDQTDYDIPDDILNHEGQDETNRQIDFDLSTGDRLVIEYMDWDTTSHEVTLYVEDSWDTATGKFAYRLFKSEIIGTEPATTVSIGDMTAVIGYWDPVLKYLKLRPGYSTITSGDASEEFTVTAFDEDITLDYLHIFEGSHTVTDIAGTTTFSENIDYAICCEDGALQALSTGGMEIGEICKITYSYKIVRYYGEYNDNNSRVIKIYPRPV